jgi:RimJ/RimL family protein N-acetyltransferase
MPALQVAAADPCAGARADWEALAASNDVALLSAYRDGLAASCSIQLGLVTAQLEMLAKADAARAQAAQGAKALVGAFAGAWAAVPGEGGECGLLPWRFEKTEAGYDRVSSGDGREPFKRIASAPPILQHSGGLKIIVRGDQMDVLPPGQRAMCKLQRQRELRMTAPILTTARLTLRAHRESDFEDLCAMWADPDVTRFIGGKPSSREESWSRLLRYGGQWSIVGYGFWAVTRTGEDKLIGDVGVMKTQRAMEPALVAPETGWCLAPEAHGQGLALEAMQAALAWADVQIGPATQCIIDRANAASIRVAEKLGYRRTHQAQYHGAAIDVWGRGV